MEYTHKPVLLDACIQALNIRPDGIYVDGTLGRAGHSMEIARRLTTGSSSASTGTRPPSTRRRTVWPPGWTG